MTATMPDTAVLVDSQPITKVNIIISGGTGSGKTTLAAALTLWASFTRANAIIGAKTLADLKGKSLTTQVRGNTGEIITQHMLQVAGLCLDQQPVGDRIHRHTRMLQREQGHFRLIDPFGKPARRMPVLPEGLERRRRNRIDGLRTDEFLHIQHIAVGGIFCAGTGPEQPLGHRAPPGEGVPA
mgnify:CR=1 FL=1